MRSLHQCAALSRRTSRFFSISVDRPLSELVKRTDDEALLDCGPFQCIRVPPAVGSTPRSSPVVLLPGMCHGPWFYRGVQEVLAEEGFESYAMDLLTINGGKTIASLADDLEAAMKLLPVERPVIAGHSQGGLLAQKYMSHVDKRMPAEKQVRAVGLIGTGSLGHYALSTRSVFSVYMALRAGGCSIPGLFDFMYLKGEAKREDEACFESHMSAFCLPESSTTNLTGVEISMREYYALMCASPGGLNGDGWPTSTHSVIESRPSPLEVPSLYVSFEHDACYPRYHATYHAEHDGSHILDVDGQPHCWVAPGWEESFARPFAQWIAEETS